MENEFNLAPIEIGGKTFEKIITRIEEEARCKLIAEMDGNNQPKGKPKVWLWNKISDPDLNPNDFLMLEDSELKLCFILTQCHGITDIRKVIANDDEIDYSKITLKEVIKRFRMEKCLKKKGVCQTRHFFVGVGRYFERSGVHILLYPEFDLDQIEKDKPHHLTVQKDQLYQEHLEWLEKNPKPNKNEENKHAVQLITSYAKQLRYCVRSI